MPEWVQLGWQRVNELVNWPTVLQTGGKVLLVVVLMWLASKVLKAALKRMEARLEKHAAEKGEGYAEAAKRSQTLARLLRQAALVTLWVLGGLMILKQLGLDIGPILAGAGVLGLAIGFGAQNLVRDMIAGFFIILENQIRVGDVAILNGTYGMVQSVNFRTSVLRDLEGTVHIFPNGTITSIANMTLEWSGYVMDIGVAYKEDVDYVMQVMHRVGADLREDPYYGSKLIGDLEIFGVNDFADSGVMIKARLVTKPITQWEVGREYRRRLKKAFDAEGIEIPFPHRSVYFGEASKPFLTQWLGERAAGAEAVASGSRAPVGTD